MADKCRVCLCGDRRMCAIRNTVFQEVWEKLTNAKFNTDDGRPLLVCYICCAQLRKSHELMKRSLKAEELLTAVINKGSQERKEYNFNCGQTACCKRQQNNPQPGGNVFARLDGYHPWSKQSQDTILLVASLTQDFRYKYTMEEVHQLDCNGSKRDTLEEIKKEYEESEEYTVEENNINIKEEEEDWTDTHREDNLNIADVEPETPSVGGTPLKKILRKEVRIILERVDTGAPARKPKLNVVPQITERIKLEETTEDIEPLTDAVLEILSNDNNKASDISGSKEQPENIIEISKSKQNIKSTVNCYQTKKISTQVNIVPQNKIQANNVIVQNSETLNFRDCCNNGENEIVKQSIPKSADAPTPEDCVIKTFNRSLHNHGGNLYLCDLCDYKSSRKDHLIIHIKFKHMNEKKFSCHMCQYKCVTKSDMRKHFRKHTGEKPYKCDLCDYRCSARSCLKTHRKYKHTNEKNYTCRICQYKCVKKNDLNRHVRKHTGEKPYKCDLCDHKCGDYSRLQIHKKYKHTKEKKFTCHVCDYKCVVKSALQRHLRKHTGEKPHTCKNCDYKSSDRSNLKKHIKSKHAK